MYTLFMMSSCLLLFQVCVVDVRAQLGFLMDKPTQHPNDGGLHHWTAGWSKGLLREREREGGREREREREREGEREREREGGGIE